MKTVEILLAIINGLIDSIAKIISRTIDYLLKKLTDCFDLENNYIKYWSFLLSVAIFFFCFCLYKTVTSTNTINKCEVECFETSRFQLIGVKAWMRPNSNLGYYQTFDEALAKAKLINCPVGK